MREIARGIQSVPLSLVSADWQSIVETSSKIQASYIMEKNLTAAQVKEIEQALPEHFKQLDAEFHQRAVRLSAAASAHDAELVSFEYSRLVETCATCYAAYANMRFPGFSPATQQNHHHQAQISEGATNLTDDIYQILIEKRNRGWNCSE